MRAAIQADVRACDPPSLAVRVDEYTVTIAGPHTIHKWRTRGGRLDGQVDATGRVLYRFRDLLALAQEVRTRQGGPRGKEGSAA